MDSGNSGSLQSSSGGGGGGGDEVYDSRTESMFLDQSTNFNSVPILQPPSNHHQQPPSTFFDPTSFTQPLNPICNLDSLWSRNPNPNPMYNLEYSHQDPTFNPNPVDGSINPDTGPEKVTKNPKKRTRASRRAPTTVLTTDTTNFRQMVQEFTGIPAAPFSASSSSSPFSRRRDIYGGGVAPLHHLRPSAQKIQLQQQPSYLNSTTATTSNFHLPPSETHGFTKQPLNLSNLTDLQNQMFPFQSISQTSNPQQITEHEQRSEPPHAFTGSSSTALKIWRGENENTMNFEGGKGNTHDSVVSSRRDGDQLPGNEDSWICPSN